MSVLQVAGLVVAGVGGGLTGSIAGLASLVTYPALLVIGLSPIGANVTNTAALVLSGVGSTVGSRPELAGQSKRIRRLLAPAVAGGVIGAVLALLTPSGLFARVVPWLIAAAAIAIFRRGPVPVTGAAPAIADRRSLPVAVAVIGLYGGYFGAAAGVVLLAVLLLSTAEPLARVSAAKNVLLGAANLAGAVVFAAFGPVRWSAAAPLAAGCLIGSRLGPVVVRRVAARPLQMTIGVLGLGLAVVLGVRAYG